MAHSLQLQDPLYKNWLLAVLGLKYVKQGLEEFVTSEVESCQTRIIHAVTTRLSTLPPIDCSAQTYFQISHKGTARPPATYTCDVHNTSELTTCGGQCSNAICYSFVRELNNCHRYSKPIWTNTTPCLWTIDPWEVGKCFLSVGGYEKTHSVADTDCTGLLSICINMKSIGDALRISNSDFKCGNDAFSKCRLHRNTILHSATYQLDTYTLAKYLDDMEFVLNMIPNPNHTAYIKANMTLLKSGKMSISEEDAEELKRNALAEIEKGKENALLEIHNMTENAKSHIKDKSEEILKEHVEKLAEQNVDLRKQNSDEEKMKNAIARWLRENEYFKNTRTTQTVVEMIKSNTCVAVTGNSGCGKSSTIHHVAIELQQHGYEILVTETPKDIVCKLDSLRKQIFVFDDPFGKGTFDHTMIRNWECQLEELKRKFQLEDKNDQFGKMINETDTPCKKYRACLLISCRIYIYKHQFLGKILRSLKMKNACMLPLSNQERKTIFESYVEGYKYGNVKCDYDYFPLLCRLSFRQNPDKVSSIFQDPPEHFKEELLAMKYQDKYQFCCICLCVMFAKGFDVTWLTIHSTEIETIHTIIQEICTELSIVKSIFLREAFKRLIHSYLKIEGNMYLLIHDKLYDIAAYVCGEALLSTFISHANSKFISERYTISDSDSYLIPIPQQNQDDYFTRIIADLSNNDITSFAFNNLLKFPIFQQNIMHYIEVNKKTSILQNTLKSSLDQIEHSLALIKEGFFEYSKFLFSFGIHKSRVLVHSIESKNTIAVGILLDLGVDVNQPIDGEIYSESYKWPTGWSLLHRAAAVGNVDILEALLENGADDTLCNNLGMSTLYIAVQRCHIDVVKVLVSRPSAKSLLRARNLQGRSLLNIAIDEYDKDMLYVLLQQKECRHASLIDNKLCPPLHQAVSLQYSDIVTLLLDCGANVSLCDHNDSSAIELAMSSGNKEIVDILLKHGAKIHACKHKSPLQIATCTASDVSEMDDYLSHNREDVFATDDFGRSPIHLAVSVRNKKMVNLLLKHNASLLSVDEDGHTPLDIAIKNNDTELFSILLKDNTITEQILHEMFPLYEVVHRYSVDALGFMLQNNADVSICDEFGWSPLHEACKINDKEKIAVLLKHGADVSLCDTFGQTPFHIAVAQGERVNEKSETNLCDNANMPEMILTAILGEHKEVIDLLLQHIDGAYINCRDSDGLTILHKAVENHNKEVIGRLIHYGADVNSLTASGISSLHIAATKQNAEIVDLLLQHDADVNASSTDGTSALHIAVRKRNRDIVNILLRHGANVNVCAFDGTSLLHDAVWWGSEMIIYLLLQHGANVNFCAKDSTSVLHTAVMRPNENIVSILLQHGADVSTCTEDGRSVLHKSVLVDNVVILRLLIRHGADLNVCCKGRSALQEAVSKQHQEIVKILLHHGADVNMCTKECPSAIYLAIMGGNKIIINLLLQHGADVITSCKNCPSALVAAVLEENVAIINLLLQYGADVNSCASDRASSLFIAVRKLNEEIVRILIHHGANMSLCTQGGRTPLYEAVWLENVVIINILLQHGADVNACSEDSIPALHLAVMTQNEEIVASLLRFGADVNMCSTDRTPALHKAVMVKNVAIVSLLLQSGVDMNLGDIDGASALHVAVLGNNEVLIKLLLQYSADVNNRDIYGWSVLYLAIEVESIKCITILLEHGADVNCCTKYGRSPLQNAVRKKNEGIVRLLIQRGANMSFRSALSIASMRHNTQK